VLGIPNAHDLDRLSRGIVIEGRRTEPAEVKLLPSGRDAAEAAIAIAVREGRNRQVRRMCEAIGHPVVHLRRIAIGPIRDPTLRVGAWRELTAEELRKLRRVVDPSGHDEGRGGKTGPAPHSNDRARSRTLNAPDHPVRRRRPRVR
jgi:16S rRNA U516 pseudouridylate synthase RsuA-like enzyme